jgi:acetyl-CoA carboxylase biotin carboxylase subunit
MLRALDEYVIGGIRSNLGLFQRILRDEEFRAARIDTGYLERLLAASEVKETERAPDDVVVLVAALFAAASKKEGSATTATAESRWTITGRREGLRA